MRKVLITDCDLGPVDVETDILKRAGFHVEFADTKSADEIAEAGADADALIVQWAKIDRHLISRLRQCQIISRYGIGVDNIDLKATAESSITVSNVDDYCVEEVASHTVALMYALARDIPRLDRKVRAGGWDNLTNQAPLSQMTIGFLGFGRIARLVAAALSTTGARLIAHDPYMTGSSGEVSIVGFETLIESSDLLSLHCPLTDNTRHVINTSALARMRPSAYLVNTARGGLVDEAALVRSLRAGGIRGAALDVFEKEPLPADSELFKLDNLIVTPHVAWSSRASLPALRQGAAENVVAFFSGRPIRVVDPSPTSSGG